MVKGGGRLFEGGMGGILGEMDITFEIWNIEYFNLQSKYITMKIIINDVEDARNSKIPIAVGSPANSRMHWYPMRKPQRIYVLERDRDKVSSDYQMRVMTKEMLDKVINVDGLLMISLEDTIIESLNDYDVQAAMAMAHRQTCIIDWKYLIRRIKDEGVEELAYIALDRFPQAGVFQHDNFAETHGQFHQKSFERKQGVCDDERYLRMKTNKLFKDIVSMLSKEIDCTSLEATHGKQSLHQQAVLI